MIQSRFLTEQEVDKISKDSNIIYLKTLYHCEKIVYLDKNENLYFKDKIEAFYHYKSSFYLSFIANKDSLSNEYLQARKALYKSYQLIKQERTQNIMSFLNDTESNTPNNNKPYNTIEQRKLQRKIASNLIFQSKDKSISIIFLDDLSSMSNLLHIHNERIDIFTKDKSIIDMQELINNYKDYGITLESLHSANTQIFLYSYLLTGGIESNKSYSECYFGELDSKNTQIGLDETKPIYYLESNDEFDTESNNSLSILNIFLNSSTLTLLNYSLLHSSLNIKLECKSKESKAILEKEKAQREKQKEQDSKTQDSLSTAMLHPILEDNDIKCPHNGVVKLKSNKGKSFKSKDIPMILESDLLNSQIIGCTNNILGVPTPCSLVSIILPNARRLKKFNDDYPIMQDLVSSGVFSDKFMLEFCFMESKESS